VTTEQFYLAQYIATQHVLDVSVIQSGFQKQADQIKALHKTL